MCARACVCVCVFHVITQTVKELLYVLQQQQHRCAHLALSGAMTPLSLALQAPLIITSPIGRTLYVFTHRLRQMFSSNPLSRPHPCQISLNRTTLSGNRSLSFLLLFIWIVKRPYFVFSGVFVQWGVLFIQAEPKPTYCWLSVEVMGR